MADPGAVDLDEIAVEAYEATRAFSSSRSCFRRVARDSGAVGTHKKTTRLGDYDMTADNFVHASESTTTLMPYSSTLVVHADSFPTKQSQVFIHPIRLCFHGTTDVNEHCYIPVPAPVSLRRPPGDLSGCLLADDWSMPPLLTRRSGLASWGGNTGGAMSGIVVDGGGAPSLTLPSPFTGVALGSEDRP